MNENARFLVMEVRLMDTLKVQRQANKMYALSGVKLHFSNHFLKRIGDPRNYPTIDIDELYDTLVRFYKKHGNHISNLDDQDKIIISDKRNGIHIPMVAVKNEKNNFTKLVAKTIVRRGKKEQSLKGGKSDKLYVETRKLAPVN